MNWDWDKLKEQQQQRGGMPPQVDEFFEKMKNAKLPGGPLLIVILVVIVLAFTSVYTVAIEEVGVVQRFGRYTRTSQAFASSYLSELRKSQKFRSAGC